MQSSGSPSGNISRSWQRPPFLLSLMVLAGVVLMGPGDGWAGDASGTVTKGGSDASVLPARVDLRPAFEKLGLERRTQGKRGTCSAFTVAGALEFALGREQAPERLSVEFLNWAANQADHSSRDGGFFSDLWKGYADYGICTDAEMPYQTQFDPANAPDHVALAGAQHRRQAGLAMHWIKPWNVHTGLTEAHLLSIRQTLSRGWPVCAGFRWPKDARWENNVLQLCGPEAVFDGHSVLLVGYQDDAAQPGGGLLIFRNTNNGGRDGLMPYAYALAYMNDALWIEAPGKSSRSLGHSLTTPMATANSRSIP